ncbi:MULTISPECIES: filamentous hemagglutinin N-terminal domain-containing protein [unclassified Nodularia (in: cyanobacteria)]|uniref:two-partner secretion domain-containing protein n=1 Tax=unclassified Nodularia (in: cyanobacteria) TaxID=2656917 RepID=UPI00187EE5C5|nr:MULTISPECIES: filamentous hemagglutinin N-terminal domain-containing protein [unclassified Nodularia (in: cyanobacteria)]MBE9200508.1 filamentous hemagglutinin N-terminal domain-containing protein [Nodularia sp. LEGE 06071]MCC2691216.1 filamentous hemagglutinin N-terminal domain-containing protein [Nodularia sp. LEGE 04288]
MKLLPVCLGYVLLPLGIILLTKNCAYAQITSDGSLNTTVIQNGNNFTVINGSAAGSNLFHGFGQFSLPTGNSATFDLVNTPDISNIFSRVTGGNISQIDGLIRTINNSNPVSLFLMNPSGIVFGPNASLNISGSFVGTTAQSIKFADGFQFNATQSVSSPLLTMSVPVGLQFGQNSGAIALQNSNNGIHQTPIGLEVDAGKTLALLGNNINITGGVLRTVNGLIELGSVNSGEVNLTPAPQGWTFDYSQVEEFNHINLTENAQVLGFGLGNSTIQMQGKDINLQASNVSTVNQGVFSFDQITINAAGKLNLQDGGRITTRNTSTGKGGNIVVNAVESISARGFKLANPSLASSISSSSAAGQAGNVTISTQKLTMTDGASILSISLGIGNGGDVQIQASDSIDVAGINQVTFLPTTITSSTVGIGNAGDLSITTGRLTVRDGSLVTSSTGSTANAGNVRIVASELIEVSGTSQNGMLSSNIGSNALRLDPITRAVYELPEFPSGNAGGVILMTPQLRVLDRADIGVKNEGTGNAGNLEVDTDSIVLTNRGTISAATQSGNGGNLLLNAEQLLFMRDRSQISVEAQLAGNGGNITLNAPVIVGLENSDIIGNAVRGSGGNIQITTQGLFGLQFREQLTPENDITASSQFGISGTVQINTVGVDPNSGLVELPANVSDPSQKIATGCSGSEGSSFVATGRGGVPQNPNQQIWSDRTWSDIRDLSTYQQTQALKAPIPKSPESLVQATSWRHNTQGQVELIANKSSAQVQQPLTCAAVTQN